MQPEKGNVLQSWSVC